MTSKAECADECLKAIKGGMSISEASRRFKVSRATIYTWKKLRPKVRPPGPPVEGVRILGATVANVPYCPNTNLYPSASDQIDALEKTLKACDLRYAELMQISKEELLDLKDNLDFLVDCLKEAMTRKLKPKAGGLPDFYKRPVFTREAAQ